MSTTTSHIPFYSAIASYITVYFYPAITNFFFNILYSIINFPWNPTFNYIGNLACMKYLLLLFGQIIAYTPFLANY